MGRPPIDLDPEKVRSLAQIHCNIEEMQLVLKVSRDTLWRRYSDVIKEGRASGKMSLRRTMWKKALEGNVPLLIWLSKNELGYSDNPQPHLESIPDDYPAPIVVETTETCSDDGPTEEE